MILLVARVALFALYSINEREFARWLPWWRRYLALLPMLLWVGNSFEHLGKHSGWLDWALWVTSIALHAWNAFAAKRNRRDGNDQRTKQAAEAKLTDVNQRSFSQQVSEATS